MVEPRTIDNLGVETSVRWAEDQHYFDQSIIKESPYITRATLIDVAIPFYKSEFDTLFQTTFRFAPWAALTAPQGFLFQKMRLFTYQAIPSLGSDELLSAQIQKIREKVEAAKEERAQNRAIGKGREYPWEDEREEEEELRQSKTLIVLLEYIQMLDSLMTQINSRRSQYSKG